VLVALAAAAAAIVPSTARADWAPPSNLAQSGWQIKDSPLVAYDASGRGYALFVRYQPFNEQLLLAERPPGGPWGAPQAVPAAGNTVFYGTDLAVSPAGDVFVAFSNGGANVVRRPAGSTTWSAVSSWFIPGSSPNQSSCLFAAPDIEVGANGDAVMAWAPYNSCNGVVHLFRELAIEFRVASGWAAAPQVWNVSPQEVHSKPSVAVDDDGSAIVAFTARSGDFPVVDRVWTAELSAAGWSSPAQLATNAAQSAPDIAMRHGRAVVAWGGGFDPGIAMVRDGGVWQPPQFMPFPGQNASSDRHVAIDGSGTAYVVADRIVGNVVQVYVASRPITGGWTAESLGVTTVSNMNPEIAVNDAGDAAMVWDEANSLPMAALRPVGGSWPTLGTPLTSVGGNNGSRPTVAVDAFGHALAAAGPVTNGLHTSVLAMIETRDPAGEPLADPPTVSPSSAEEGTTLTCGTGTFEGTPPFRYAYEWLQDSNPIPDATSSTYVVRADDAGLGISCRVTATNEAGSAFADADEVLVDLTVPTVVTPPTITGTPAVGEALGCLPGTWRGGPTPLFEFEWLRNGAPVPDETADTYVLDLADGGAQIRCRVTAVNDAGATVATTAAVSVPTVLAPVNLTNPTITGPVQSAVKVGDTLTCSAGTWSGAPTPTVTVEWLRGGVPTGDETSTRTVVADDAGQTLTCLVTAENVVASVSELSANSRTIPAAPANTRLPSVGVSAGTFGVGGTAQCNNGGWQRALTFAYQWLRNGSPMPTATARTYPITSADAGTTLACVVTASGRGGSASATSPGRSVAPPPVLVTAPTLTGAAITNGTVRSNGKVVRCNRGTWTGANSFTISWLRNGTVVSTGPTSYTTSAADIGAQLRCRVTATGNGGSSVADSNSVSVVR
jgi:hypothetical protein